MRQPLKFVNYAFIVGCVAALEFVHNPDLELPITETISKHGYPVEEHTVITEDEYILTMHRIPHGRNVSNSLTNQPVLLMHGILGSAEYWTLLGPGKSLAYLLADNGYDVWMGNSRGSMYSRKHVRLDPNIDKTYWQFSFHELGVYDLPAKINYILGHTGQKKLMYFGHSQGTTCFFVMASEKPEYNDKIKLMLAFAPVAFMSNVRSPILRIAAIVSPLIQRVLSSLNIYELSGGKLIRLISTFICEEKSIFQEICANFIFATAGYDSSQLNRTVVPNLTYVTFTGGSVRQVAHFAQEIISGYFRQFDFGMISNILKYGRMSPPEYNLKLITAPVANFYSTNDWITSYKDVQKLNKKLPNLVVDHLMSYKMFNHLDFLFATDVKPLLYNEVFHILKRYS